MFLVDANILSEATKPAPSPQVLDWIDSNETQLVVNPIILGELQYGILQLPSGKRRTRLLNWFESGILLLPVLEIDAFTARVWAMLLADLKRSGQNMPVKDSLIAATAKQHRLTVATRNIADFRHAGVRLVNPFGNPSE